MNRALGAMLGVLGVTSGCALQSPVAVPDGTLLQATTDPGQYRSALPHEARPPPWKETAGSACRTLLSFPPNPPTPFLGSDQVASKIPWRSLGVTFGNDGYALAVSRARQAAGGGTLFDVRADVHTTSVLGIWRRECIEIHALVSR